MPTVRYVAELIGTFIFMIIGSMTALAATAVNEGQLGLLLVPVGFGLGYLAARFAVGHVSGGHFNPGVTLAIYLDGQVSAVDLIGYWVAQVVGALGASVLLLLVSSRDVIATTVARYVTPDLGIMAELTLTAIFVLVFLTSIRLVSEASRTVAVSLTLTVVSLAGLPFSGAAFNPARALAPVVVSGRVERWWLYLTVYLLVPLVGAVLAWGLAQLFRLVEENGSNTEESIEVAESPVPATEDLTSQ